MIENLDTICNEIFDRWDKDQRSGKLLSALAGRLPVTYRKDVSEIRRALIVYQDMLTALQLTLRRLGELNRDDEAGLRIVLANAIKRATQL